MITLVDGARKIHIVKLQFSLIATVVIIKSLGAVRLIHSRYISTYIKDIAWYMKVWIISIKKH